MPKKLFAVCTSGVGRGVYAKRFSLYLNRNGFDVLGGFECKGFDTFGLSKIFGGFAKGHPDSQDVKNAVFFLKDIIH
ncbi:MAG: hypothetical protein ACTTHG_02495 [Treponemataceae bacterium]